jgi:branched-chain amino acid transport system substrate-binding protein
MRKILAITTAVAAATALAACESDAGSDTEYTVYAVIDQTGALGPVYSPAAAGVRAYFDELNDDGGVNGKKINLVVRDSQSTPDAAQAQYRQALDAQPVAIFAMSSSTGVSAAAPLLMRSGVPTLGVGVADELLYPPQGSLYMLQPTSGQQVQYGLDLVQQLTGGSLEGKRLAMIGISPSSIIDTAYKAIDEKLEEEGGEVVEIQRPTTPIASFATQAVVVAKSSPDAVFMNLPPTDAISVSKALKDAGLDVPMIVLPSSGTDAPEVFESIDSENYYAVRFVRPPSETDHADIAGSKYKNSATWQTGWMFGQIVTEALKECGDDCDAAALNGVLESGYEINLGDVGFAPVAFSKDEHDGVSAVQYYGWDKASSRPVESGEAISLGD